MGYQFNSAGGISNSANRIKFKINCREPENNNQLLTSVSRTVKISDSGFFLTSVSKETGGEFVVIYIYTYIHYVSL